MTLDQCYERSRFSYPGIRIVESNAEDENRQITPTSQTSNILRNFIYFDKKPCFRNLSNSQLEFLSNFSGHRCFGKKWFCKVWYAPRRNHNTWLISSEVTPEHAERDIEETFTSFAKVAHALTVKSRAVYEEDCSANAYWSRLAPNVIAVITCEPCISRNLPIVVKNLRHCFYYSD